MNPEQQQWLDQLDPEALGYVVKLVDREGVDYYLSHWGFLRDEMEYLQTLL